MFEYIFFDEGLRQKLVDYARSRDVAATMSDDDGCLARVPEDVDEDVAEAIDDYYERLLQENADLLDGTEDGWEKNAGGVRVELSDGTPCNIKLDADVMSRVLNCISLEELRDMVQAIAEGVENPDDRPLCQR